MAGTTPAGLVTCARCGRVVKGYQSTEYERVPGVPRGSFGSVRKVLRIYPHRHLSHVTRLDCDGRFYVAQPVESADARS